MWHFKNIRELLASRLRKERSQDEQILYQLGQANQIFKKALSLEGTQGMRSVFKDERKKNKWPVGGWFILKSETDIIEFKGYLHQILVLLNTILKEAKRIELLSTDVVRRVNRSKYRDDLPRPMKEILAPSELEIISYCRNLETKLKEVLSCLNSIIQKGYWSPHADVNMVPFRTYWSHGNTNDWIIYLYKELPVLESNFEKLLGLIKKVQTDIKK